MENIFQKIKERKNKITLSVTIDLELYDKIVEFKKEQKIERLSPFVNAILWDWFKSHQTISEKSEAQRNDNEKGKRKIVSEVLHAKSKTA